MLFQNVNQGNQQMETLQVQKSVVGKEVTGGYERKKFLDIEAINLFFLM